MDKNFLPMSATQLAKTKIATVKYMEAYPRVYRFDAKDGLVKDHNGSPLMKSGDFLTIIPLSYRLFFAELFGYSPRNWLEFFFLNASGQVCSLLFHGYSTQQFEEECAALFYEDAAVNEAEFQIRPMQKEKMLEDGAKIKYFIADFRVKALTGKAIKKPAEIIESLPPVYRRDTTQGAQELLRWLGYPEKLPRVERVSATEPASLPPSE